MKYSQNDWGISIAILPVPLEQYQHTEHSGQQDQDLAEEVELAKIPQHGAHVPLRPREGEDDLHGGVHEGKGHARRRS